MEFDVNKQKCTIIIDENLSNGLAINAASVIGISFGRMVEHLVGPDKYSMDEVNYPGVIYSPLPVLTSTGDHLQELLALSQREGSVHAMPFSALAQSCKTYEEYGEKISSVDSQNIKLVAIGLIGPKKVINRHTGNLALFK